MSLKARKIVLMEEDALFRETLTELLFIEGYEVYQTGKGYAGLQIAKTLLPHLIICSRMFPDISCWEVFQALQMEEATKQIPFIFLSSKPAGEYHQMIEANKSAIILIKPFVFEELLQILLFHRFSQ